MKTILEKIKNQIRPSRNSEKKVRTEFSKEKILLRAAMVLIPAVLILVAVLVLNQLVQKSASYKVEAECIQFYDGQKYSIPEGSVFVPNQEGGTTVQFDGATRLLGNIPVYGINEKLLILPCDMIFYAPRENIRGKLSQFTVLSYDAYGVYEASNGKTTSEMKQGFLYDGGNMYIFTESCKLSFNGYTFDLGPMSYVEADGSNRIIVYNTKDGQCYNEMPTTKVIVEVSGAYTVSLLGDSMETADGSKTLLITRPEILDALF